MTTVRAEDCTTLEGKAHAKQKRIVAAMDRQDEQMKKGELT